MDLCDHRRRAVEVVDHGVTGFVADNVEDYARAVITLLQDPTLCRKMGDAGRDKVARNYEAKIITRGLEEVFETLYEKKVRTVSEGIGTS